MTPPNSGTARVPLDDACCAVGLDSADAVPVRMAENEVWRLPGRGVIVRIGQAGQEAAARREVAVAKWLHGGGLPAVRPLPVEQPHVVGDRPVTFWHEVRSIEQGSIDDVALLLRQLHALTPPSFELGRLDPFVRVPERLDAAWTLSLDDRRWLASLCESLSTEWQSIAPRVETAVIHGDAWPGNLVRTPDGPLLMDLERFSLGPTDWDLVSTAVRWQTTGAVTTGEYQHFCKVYGRDVTTAGHYRLLAGARELRMVSYAAQHATSHPEWASQAQHRVDCLRGRKGSRPWNWKGIL
ncbi:phosphotransferase family protein [Streptomyces sp. Qhu_M48]|uniref:phosphotransferase family protein n=1 Tax=Streptomyces sp. Qhu_M48 TaxID=3435889 RepID=UPI003F4F79D1